MAWCHPGDKPLSEPNGGQFIDAYMRHSLNGLMQECGSFSALPVELLQSCMKPSIVELP